MIVKNPRGKDVNDGDIFIFNKDFTNALYKIKINQVIMGVRICFPRIVYPNVYSNIFFCMELKISITTALFWFSILGKLDIGLVKVIGYFRYKSWDWFKLFFSCFFLPL